MQYSWTNIFPANEQINDNIAEWIDKLIGDFHSGVILNRKIDVRLQTITTTVIDNKVYVYAMFTKEN